MENTGNFIGGQWVRPVSGETYNLFSPANTADLIGAFPKSAPEDMERAVECAAQAAREWGRLSPVTRGEILRRAARLIEERTNAIAVDLAREVGKPLFEARGEVARAASIFDFYAGEGRRLGGETLSGSEEDVILLTQRRPLGVVGLITPWNFPIAIPAWKMAPALIAGNAVVIKPASVAPLTCTHLVRCVVEAGLPPGVVNVVVGPGQTLGEALVRHPVAAISFTGSTENGRKLQVKAAERGLKTQLEMGGKNPFIVMPDADLEKAADLVAAGAFYYAGQKCSATSRAIVLDSVYQEFTSIVVDRAKNLVVGDPLREDVRMGPVIHEWAMNDILGYIAKGLEQGGEILCGGHRLTGDEYDRGWFVAPTVITGVRPDSTVAQEEIFGPVLTVIQAGDFEQAIAIANGVRYGLVAGIATKDMTNARRFMDEVEAGILMINRMTAGMEPHVPFGGLKDSGAGQKEQGRIALDFFTDVQTVYWKLP